MTITETKQNQALHGIALGNLALIDKCNDNLAKAKDIATFNYWNEQKKECIAMYEDAMDELLQNHIKLNL